MGIYTFALTLPKNTLETDPVSQSVNVNRGIIKEIEVYYPLNNNRFGKVWLHADGRQILPSNIEGDFTGNGNIQILKPNVEIFDSVLTLVGFNLDTVFAHNITATVTIYEKETINGIVSDLESF